MIERDAPAKINLYLRIVGRRDDGYHLLDTLVAFAGLADRVAVDAADDLSLEIDGPFAAPLAAEAMADNLVMRAARTLASTLGIAPRAHLRLTKNIPVGGGLGGGSADAAAVLRALCTLWQADLSEHDLADVALRLGADVPMCLAGRAACVSGIGERIGPALRLPACGLLLVHPRILLPTAAVFRAAGARPPWSPSLPVTKLPDTVAGLAGMLAVRGNDLTDAAVSLVPAIGAVLARLRATTGCRHAAMSGSGAACFALYDDVVLADAARLDVAQAQPQWWTDAGVLR
jgi:4-diphosphocytidyl-2-C-methyl-D-erythritol kinase